MGQDRRQTARPAPLHRGTVMNDVSAASQPSITRAEHATAMKAYQEEGVRVAAKIGNRGPVRFGPDGKLHRDIVEAYWKHGFYIFEGVIEQEELAELRQGCMEML